jgi:hypothetical protein
MRLPGRAGLTALLATLAVGLATHVAVAQAAPAPQDRPDLTGEWALDRKASDDVQAKTEAAAGPGYVKGSERATRVLPTGNEKSEVERLELRDLLLGLIGSLDAMEIAQSARDVKLVRGDDVGIFYFDREHVRVGLHGRKLRCRTTWKGPQLVIDQSGDDKAHVVQLLTLLPEGKRLIVAIRIEYARLREPLELKLVYDRAGKPVSGP